MTKKLKKILDYYDWRKVLDYNDFERSLCRFLLKTTDLK